MTHIDDASSGREDRDSVLITVQQYLGGSTEDRAHATLAAVWDLFYETHTPLIDVMVFSSRLSKHDAEDCAQEVWLELVRWFPRLKVDDPAGFSGWLATIARTQVARQVQDKWKRYRIREGGAHNFNGLICPVGDFDRIDDRELVANALARLKRKTSELNYRILHMRMIEESSVQEVADRLDLSRDQVRARHHRAMKALRAIIEDLVT